MEVGIRELKNNLSRYLAQVGNGDEVIVTDRGRAVARITPIGVERTIDRLIAQGVVIPASETKRAAPTKRETTKQPVSPLIAEQRR